MKQVVIFDKNEYSAMCYLIDNAFECAVHCPKSFYVNEVINKLRQVKKMLEEEEK